MKELEETPEKELNERMEAKNLSDMEFKVIVIWMLNKPTVNYNSMKKDIETITI